MKKILAAINNLQNIIFQNCVVFASSIVASSISLAKKKYKEKILSNKTLSDQVRLR